MTNPEMLFYRKTATQNTNSFMLWINFDRNPLKRISSGHAMDYSAKLRLAAR